MIADTVGAIWRRELRLDEVAPDDDFFALGGHSVVMARIQTALWEELEVEVPMEQLYRHPTVASMATYLESVARVSP